MALCPNCHKNIFEGQFRCDHCGAIIATVKKETPKKPTKGKEKK